MYCKNCGEAINENQAICVKCGVKVGDGNQFVTTAVRMLLQVQMFVSTVV